MYLRPAQRRRGLRGLRGVVPPSVGIAAEQAGATGDNSGCWLMYVFGKAAYDNCVNTAGIAQIQSVANNAQAYGYPQSVQDVANQTAAYQESLVPGDTATIDSLYNLPSSPFLPSLNPGFDPGDPSTWPIWIWIVVIGGGGLLAVAALK